MAKDNVNPFAEAEFALRDLIRGIPEVSGVFDDAETQVFAASQEDFGEKIASLLAGTLGSGICVATEGTSGEIRRDKDGRLSDVVRWRVEIKTSLLLAEGTPRSATDLAAAVIRTLEGTRFDAPFSSLDFVRYAGAEIADFDDGSRVVTLRFAARVDLNF